MARRKSTKWTRIGKSNFYKRFKRGKEVKRQFSRKRAKTVNKIISTWKIKIQERLEERQPMSNDTFDLIPFQEGSAVLFFNGNEVRRFIFNGLLDFQDKLRNALFVRSAGYDPNWTHDQLEIQFTKKR